MAGDPKLDEADDPKVEKLGVDPTLTLSGGADECLTAPEMSPRKWGTTDPIWARIPIFGRRFRRDVSDDVVSKSVDQQQGPQ